VGPIPMVLEIYPAIVNRFERFFRGGLHTGAFGDSYGPTETFL
jgi:hypothetical protein